MISMGGFVEELSENGFQLLNSPEPQIDLLDVG